MDSSLHQDDEDDTVWLMHCNTMLQGQCEMANPARNQLGPRFLFTIKTDVLAS